MTYDYHGGWSRFTGGNSPLFSRYHDRFDPRLSIEWSVKRWIKAGAPPKKLILGNIHEIPFSNFSAHLFLLKILKG